MELSSSVMYGQRRQGPQGLIFIRNFPTYNVSFKNLNTRVKYKNNTGLDSDCMHIYY